MNTDVRVFKGMVSLLATPSNAVEVAFGTSRDGTGVLLPDDETFAVGWDGGSWFVASATNRVCSAPLEGAAWRSLSFKLHVSKTGDPCALSLSADGAGDAFAALAASPPDWMFSRTWDAEEAGFGVPGTHGGNPLLPYPPLANDWATGAIPIPGWTHLTTEYPEPGWIVGHPSSSGSGHCGIVDYDGFAIAAGKDEVNRKYSRFLDGSCGYNKKTEGSGQ